MYAKIEAIEYYLPEMELDNETLASLSENWTADAIKQKTGIRTRHLAADEQLSSDLAVSAGKKLLEKHDIPANEIDYLIVCTQTPDYLLPGTSSLVHHQLGLSSKAGAFDINLGCSGYTYCLSIAKGLIETGHASKLLLITTDTYSKLLAAEDLSVRTLFGDAASATLLIAGATKPCLHSFCQGTDGSGAEFLIVEGAAIKPTSVSQSYIRPRLTMDGPSIFHFTLKAVPELIRDVLDKSQKKLEEIDWFVFHQANEFMLEHLRKKLKIPHEKFVIDMADCGNTVSSTIPIVLSRMSHQNQLQMGDQIMLIGFGVGLSWCGGLLTWEM